MRLPDGNAQHVLFAGGVASSLCQLTALRELLTLLQGNEFVLALSLFNWLAMGGLGAWLGRGCTVSGRGMAWLCGLMTLLAFLAPGQILGMRWLREALFTSGSAVGFYGSLLFSALALAPVGMLLGFLFPFALTVLRQRQPDFSGGRGYILESAGCIAGALLFSFWLVYHATPLQVSALAGLVVLVSVFLIGRQTPCWRFVSLACAPLLLLSPLAERASLAPGAGQLIDYRETPYGRLTAVADRGEITLFADGLPFLTSRDLQSAEEAAHFPLSQVEAPGRILLVGGGGELLDEVAKHRPRAIDLVELNPALTAMQERHGLLRRGPSLRILHRDGRRHLQEHAGRYDAILVNLPEPETFQVNRFYTSEFFSLARSRLTRRGVLAFSLQGYDQYLDEAARDKLAVILATARDLFPHLLVLPGGRVHFLCSAAPLAPDIAGRLANRSIETAYIGAYLAEDLSAERIERLRSLIDRQAPRNRDLRPALMRIMFSQWFRRFDASPLGFYAALAAVLALFLLRAGRETFLLFTTGYAAMGCEIVLIFAFQITYGYLYQQLGLIVTAFLAGLPLGAWLARGRWGQARRVLPISECLLLGLLGLLFLLLAFECRLPVALFLLIGFLTSLVCGFQFPLALSRKGDAPSAAGGLYAADLFGAACGTLVTSVVLLPQGGLLLAAGGVMAIKLISLLRTVRHETAQST